MEWIKALLLWPARIVLVLGGCYALLYLIYKTCQAYSFNLPLSFLHPKPQLRLIEHNASEIETTEIEVTEIKQVG